jgi:hypothetical protein
MFDLSFTCGKAEQMGEPNNVLNVYMSKPERIKSVLEYHLGEKLPEDWEYEVENGFYSIRSYSTKNVSEKNKLKISYRQRDILKKVKAPEGTFLLGIENQDTINLTLPFRLMQMDGLDYERNVEDIQQQNADKPASSYGAEDDFKYRFFKDDRLKPVVNLTLYWGRKKWQTPLRLRDMLDISALPEGLQNLVGDYPVHLIHMRSIPDEDLEKMDSDLKYVLGMLKCSRSKRKYQAFIEKNKDYFRRIPRSAVDVLDVFMNIKGVMQYLQYIENEENDEEVADMCKALDDIVKDSEKRGEKRGRQEGRQEGRESTTILSIANLMKNLHLTAEQAMEALEVPQSQWKKYEGLLPAKG